MVSEDEGENKHTLFMTVGTRWLEVPPNTVRKKKTHVWRENDEQIPGDVKFDKFYFYFLSFCGCTCGIWKFLELEGK